MLALQSTITENEEAAAGGCPQARAVCAKTEEKLDHLLREALRPKRDEKFEADMLDLAGTSDPYAPARPSNYD